MTKIIQSGLSHGFHLLLIALPALRGHSPHCRSGQGRCRLHLHNGPNSRRDYQYLHILHASKSHYPRSSTRALQHVKCCYCTTLESFSTTCHVVFGVSACVYVCCVVPNPDRAAIRLYLYLFVAVFGPQRADSVSPIAYRSKHTTD